MIDVGEYFGILPYEIMIHICNFLTDKDRKEIKNINKAFFDFIAAYYDHTAYGNLVSLSYRFNSNKNDLIRAINLYHQQQLPSFFNWRHFSSPESKRLAVFLFLIMPSLMYSVIQKFRLQPNFREEWFQNVLKVALVVLIPLCLWSSIKRAKSTMANSVIDQKARDALNELIRIYPILQSLGFMGQRNNPQLTYHQLNVLIDRIIGIFQAISDEMEIQKNSLRGKNISSLNFTLFRTEYSQEILTNYQNTHDLQNKPKGKIKSARS